jgi:hypothetical protein
LALIFFSINMKPQRVGTIREHAKTYRETKSNAIKGLQRALAAAGMRYMRSQTDVVNAAIEYITWANRELQVPSVVESVDSVVESVDSVPPLPAEHDTPFLILPMDEEVVSEEWTTFLMQ